MKDFIVFGQPNIDNSDIKAVADVLKSRWLGYGPKTQEFEKRFRNYIGTKYAVALNSGTAALFLSLESLAIGSGDEVITTPINFAAAANVIVRLGAKPVFTDVDKATFNISLQEIEKNITPKTKAILLVHFAGRPCQMEAISSMAKKYNLAVIEDCAHAIESQYKGKHCGSFGETGCFSFYATKSITTGEGGILVTNRGDIAEKAKLRSLHGLSKDVWQRYGNKKNFYEVLAHGFKYNMHDISAALGLSQFKKIKKNFIIRKKIWNQYLVGLANLKEIVLPAPIQDNIIHARHLFTILLDLDKLAISRNKLAVILQKKKIGTGIHFLALHKQPAFIKTLGKKITLPNAEYISQRVISLPFQASLTQKQVDYIIKTVREIIQTHRK